jgi:periplasmic protein TonB
MVSLHDLRSPAVAMDWHEAVAVAAALAAQIVEDSAAAGHATACPHPDDVVLRSSGSLGVTGPRHVGATPAQGIALVLAQLLESAPCPAELRQLVESFADVATEPAADGPAAFLARLAFFERPGRTEVLAALATRAERAVEGAVRTAALDALTERARQAADDPAPRGLAALLAGGPSAGSAGTVARPAGPDSAALEGSPAPASATRWLAPAGLALLAFVVAASAASWWLAPAAPAVGTREEEDLPIEGSGGAPRTRPSGSNAPPARRSAGDPVEPTHPPSRPAAATDSEPAPTPLAPNSAAASGSAAPIGSTPRRPKPALDVIVAERDGRVVPPGVAASGPAKATPGRVFTEADTQVTPALLIRPHLPAQPPPDVPEEQIGTLEVVVTESGTVEHVHLISPANRFQERMLVAAAKTWQFQPAMRDGRPVRYRKRIRVTL